jgi:hypothetical protein
MGLFVVWEVEVLLQVRVTREVRGRAKVEPAHVFEHVDCRPIIEVLQALHVFKYYFRLRPEPL